jgi:hypothetical protein
MTTTKTMTTNNPPPPWVIPDWRRVERGHPKVIPDWREFGVFGMDWRRVEHGSAFPILAIPAILAITNTPSPPYSTRIAKELALRSQIGVDFKGFTLPIPAMTRDAGDHGDLPPPPLVSHCIPAHPRLA